MYKPHPIDTSQIKLPETIVRLTERLAENNHEVWAQQRMAEGWTYGPGRDDGRKTHPDLIPFEDLPDAEKEYDRITAMQTLKTILALGYRIVDPAFGTTAAATDGEVVAVLQRLQDQAYLDLTALLALWKAHAPAWWTSTPELCQRLGERILRVGEPLLAYDVLAAGLAFWPRDVRLRQLLALALARSGAPELANALLRQLYDEGQRDGETLGILARTHKDLWIRAADPAEQTHELRRAHDLYNQGYQLACQREHRDEAIYNGINAATTASLLGQTGLAQHLASQVRELCQAKLQTTADYWAQASLGEAAVILGEYAEAEIHYGTAAALGRENIADLSTTQRTARWLAARLCDDVHHFDHCFGLPPVIVFAGHMIDRPGRAIPRFPAQLEGAVASEIAARLEALHANMGYSSAACGADILFLEAMQQRGGETHIILPLPHDIFQRTSVDIIPGAHWGQRFRDVLQRATSVTVINEHYTTGGAVGYAYANLIQDGLALLRAQALETALLPLVVWDGAQGDGPGGTASMVEHWRLQGREPLVIPLTSDAMTITSAPSQIVTTPGAPGVADHTALPLESAEQIKAMLFADVVGYSKLTEAQQPRFAEHFLGAVAALMAASPHAPVFQNTWGDALFLVFNTVADAGLFALALRDRLCNTAWADRGLPQELTLRIALHAGPVTGCVDPVTQQPNYVGSHVSWAARIEPITPHGQVYASQPFAALAAAQGMTTFICDYAGLVPLPKGYGTFPTYHVHYRTRPTS